MKKYCYFLMLFLMVSTCYAQGGNAANELEHLLNAVKTMQASFTQTTIDSRGRVGERASGNMAIERPGKFRWEIKKPIPQLIIANVSRLYIYDPDLQQLTIRSMGRIGSGTPALLLSQTNSRIDEDFSVKSLSDRKGLHWYELIPKKRDNMFASIKMAFAKTEIREMDLQDHLGHTTLVQFAKATLNEPLRSSLFTFKPPANVDVIDETKRKG